MADNESPAVTNPYLWTPDTDFTALDELSEEEIEEQAELLREAVREHDRRYYNKDDPIIADRTYDKLFSRLQDIEETYGLEVQDSPTQRVGGEPVDEFETVEHVAPMLFDRLEVGGVELLVEVRATLVGEAVEAARDPLDEPVATENSKPVAGVVTNSDPEVADGTGREIPLVPHQLQDLIVDRVHPLRTLSHRCGTGGCVHSSSGVYADTIHYGLRMPVKRVISP